MKDNFEKNFFNSLIWTSGSYGALLMKSDSVFGRTPKEDSQRKNSQLYFNKITDLLEANDTLDRLGDNDNKARYLGVAADFADDLIGTNSKYGSPFISVLENFMSRKPKIAKHHTIKKPTTVARHSSGTGLIEIRPERNLIDRTQDAEHETWHQMQTILNSFLEDQAYRNYRHPKKDDKDRPDAVENNLARKIRAFAPYDSFEIAPENNLLEGEGGAYTLYKRFYETSPRINDFYKKEEPNHYNPQINMLRLLLHASGAPEKSWPEHLQYPTTGSAREVKSDPRQPNNLPRKPWYKFWGKSVNYSNMWVPGLERPKTDFWAPTSIPKFVAEEKVPEDHINKLIQENRYPHSLRHVTTNLPKLLEEGPKKGIGLDEDNPYIRSGFSTTYAPSVESYLNSLLIGTLAAKGEIGFSDIIKMYQNTVPQKYLNEILNSKLINENEPPTQVVDKIEWYIPSTPIEKNPLPLASYGIGGLIHSDRLHSINPREIGVVDAYADINTPYVTHRDREKELRFPKSRVQVKENKDQLPIWMPKSAKSFKLFLDDLRDPEDNSWTVARSVQEAQNLIQEQGYPNVISFDHDLGDQTTGEMGPSGLDLAKWLVEQDLDGNLLPDDFEFKVHSANPVGAENIRSLLTQYLEYKRGRGVQKANLSDYSNIWVPKFDDSGYDFLGFAPKENSNNTSKNISNEFYNIKGGPLYHVSVNKPQLLSEGYVTKKEEGLTGPTNLSRKQVSTTFDKQTAKNIFTSLLASTLSGSDKLDPRWFIKELKNSGKDQKEYIEALFREKGLNLSNKKIDINKLEKLTTNLAMIGDNIWNIPSLLPGFYTPHKPNKIGITSVFAHKDAIPEYKRNENELRFAPDEVLFFDTDRQGSPKLPVNVQKALAWASGGHAALVTRK